MAALWRPGMDGSSGIVASHLSSPDLKISTFSWFISLSSLGMMLKSLAPCTDKDASLALLKGRRFRIVAIDYCQCPSSVALVETNVVALDQPLGHLPKENDPIPLPTALLGIEL